MFYVAANMVWLKVVNNNIDEYLDKDNVSRELISYEGKKTNLEYYIIRCNYKGVEKKLNQGEKVNQIFKKSGKTPLMIAATLPDFKDAIKMSQILIKEGADVNKRDIYGANVLFYVGYYDYEKRTSEENIKLLKYYIDKDTEINIKIDGVDNDGNLKKNGKRIYLLETVPLHLSERLESIDDKTDFCRELWHKEGKGYKNPVICIPKIYKQSLFEVDGFREHISAKTGDRFVMRNAEQLCLNAESAQIIKNVLKFNQRKQVQKELKVTVHDKITEENLINIFEAFISKIQTSIYRNKFKKFVSLMIKEKGTFIELSMEDKCKCIGEILHLFQCNPVLSNLQLIGGEKASGKISMGKKFDGNEKVFLILQSVTGFFEKKILLAPYEKK